MWDDAEPVGCTRDERAILHAAELDESITAARICMFPSRSGVSDIKILEALAASKPVIVSDTCRAFAGGELGDVGLVVSPDEAAVSEAITKFGGNAPMYEKAIAAAGSVAKGYTWDGAAREIADMYESVIG